MNPNRGHIQIKRNGTLVHSFNADDDIWKTDQDIEDLLIRMAKEFTKEGSNIFSIQLKDSNGVITSICWDKTNLIL